MIDIVDGVNMGEHFHDFLSTYIIAVVSECNIEAPQTLEGEGSKIQQGCGGNKERKRQKTSPLQRPICRLNNR